METKRSSGWAPAPGSPATSPVLRAIDEQNVEAFASYVDDHRQDNGRGGTPLFQPQSRAVASSVAERIALFRSGLAIPVGQPGWRRGWVAMDGRARRETGSAIIGHVDLRAHAEPCAAHRALLGLGAHRDHRGRGLGTALVTFAISWAVTETALEWIDLAVLAGNIPAERLYRRVGFHQVATVPDMYRVDGRTVDNTMMALRLRPAMIMR